MRYLKSAYKLIIVMVLIALPFSCVRASFGVTGEEFLAFINNYRSGNSLGVLSLDLKLQDAADWMSDDMLANCVEGVNPCSHTDFGGRSFSQRLRDFGYPAGVSASAGENIAWGTGRELTAEQAFSMWKGNPGHNANMLNGAYGAIGISRSCNGGSCAWVTDFGSKVVQAYNLTPIPIPTLALIPFPVPSSSSSLTPTLIPTLILTPTPVLTPIPLPDTNNNSYTEQKSGSSEPGLPEGSIVREKGRIDVYVIKYANSKKFKRLILSPAVFKNYGHLKWEDIITVDKIVLDSFTVSTLVCAAGDGKVYKLYPSGDTGEKRWIKTEEAFNRFEFDWDAVYEINQFDKDSYFTGNSLE